MALLSLLTLAATASMLSPERASASTATQLTIAVIGDYGCLATTCAERSTQQEVAVANLVHSWQPSAILTVGDNSYETGTAAEVAADQQPYATDITAGRFFPVAGNHDWGDQCTDPTWIQASTSYFGLPAHYVAHLGGGLVDFFATDMNCADSDGDAAGSPQASGYKSAVDASTAIWKLTGGHQPFYSSGLAGTQQYTHWALNPLIDLYLSGHDHDFEHLVEGGQNFIVNGVGGSDLHTMGSPIAGSVWNDTQDFGAVRLTITQTSLQADFVNLAGTVLHTFTLAKDPTRGNIAGTVTDAISGQPLSGATVRDGSASVTTSPDGTYLLTGVTDGTYTVTASAAGHDTATQTANVSGSTTADLNFALSPSAAARVGSITGTVSDSATNQPIAGATVSYGGASTQSAANGSYTLPNVSPGTYTVSASASLHSTLSQPVAVTTGIRYVQGAAQNAGTGNGSGATSVTAALPAPVAAGDRIVVGVRVDSNPSGAVVGNMADSAADTYTMHANASNHEPAGFQSQVSVWSAVASGSGPLQVTATSSSSADISIAVAEYAGLSTASGAAAVDGTAGAGAVSTANPSTTPTAPTAATNDLSVGVYGDGGAGVPVTAGTGWTARLNNSPSNTGTIVLEDQQPETLGSTPNATFTTSSPTSWATVLVNFVGQSPPPTIQNFPLPPASGAITGVVTDVSTGAGIAGATVSYSGGSATTDAGGAYALANVVEGTYTLTASAQGYGSVNTSVNVAPATTTTQNFALSQAPGSISGVVTDSRSGLAVAGATVAVPGSSTTTSATGGYTLSALPPGAYTVRATAAGYFAQSAAVAVPAAGNVVQDYHLSPSTGAIAGTVIDSATKQPIAGATVSYAGGSATTDGNGAYALYGLAAGSYTLTTSAPNHTTASQQVTVSTAPKYVQGAIQNAGSGSGSGATSASTTLAGTSAAGDRIVVAVRVDSSPNGAVVANVTDSAGNVYSRHVTAQNSRPSGYQAQVTIWSAVVAAGAKLTITASSTASADITVAAAEYAGLGGSGGPAAVDVTAGAGSVATTNPATGPTAAVSAANELAVAAYGDGGAAVAISAGTGWTMRLNNSPNGAGTGALEDQLPASGAQVNARFTDSSPTSWAAAVAVFVAGTPPTLTQNFGLAPTTGAIAGTVTNAANGQPVAGATVAYSGGSTTTSAAGSYLLANLPAGTYTVSVSAAGYGSASSSATVVNGQQTTLNFGLAASPGQISGTVTNATTGQPIGGATVSYSGGSTTTNASGQYTLANVTAGTVAVTAGAAGFGNQSASVSVPAGGSAGQSFALTPVTPTGRYVQGATQNAGSGNGSGATSVSATMGAAVAAGDRIVVAVRVDSSPNAALVGTVTDSAGNTYTKHVTAQNNRPGGYQSQVTIWSAVVSAGAGTKLAVTATATSSADISIATAEYAGLSSVSGAVEVDVVAGAGGVSTSNPASGPTAPVAAANELAVGAYGDGGSGATIGAGSGWTMHGNNSPNVIGTIALEDQTEAAGSQANAQFTNSSPSSWAAAVVVFRLT